MANLQRVLGTLLATRMARRGGLGGALGTAALMGALGRGRKRGGRGSGLGRKAGLAALGYLAYRAYQNNQKTSEIESGSGSRPVPPGGTSSAGGISGAVGGFIDRIAGGGPSARSSADGPTLGERISRALSRTPAPSETEEVVIDDRRALLLIRAMIAAANSDGEVSPDERRRIVSKIDEAGGDADDHRILEQELQSPVPLDTLLREVNDQETAQQFYLASKVAVGDNGVVQNSYLAYLQRRLDLGPELIAEVEQMTS
jgi:uncharacterized membrane protein YebE (DUF533 family)